MAKGSAKPRSESDEEGAVEAPPLPSRGESPRESQREKTIRHFIRLYGAVAGPRKAEEYLKKSK